MRIRFNTEEKTAIAGGDIEVRNGRYWHPAKVTGPIARPEDTVYGCVFWRVPILITAGKFKGESWDASPGHIRARG